MVLQTLELAHPVSIWLPNFKDVIRLYDNLEVTGKESSLLRILSVRSCAFMTVKTSEHGACTARIGAGDWNGQQIGSYTAVCQTREMPRANHLQVYMPMEAHNGGCTLEIKRGAEICAIQAPCATRRGDWFILARSWATRARSCGLIVRDVGEGTYTVIGQTYAVKTMEKSGFNFGFHELKGFEFSEYWNVEDALILAWTTRQLLSEDIQQDRIQELINRRVCAWDDSSYFQEGNWWD